MSFCLRLATPDDAAAIRDIYSPFVAETPISFETEPPSVAEMATRIEETLPDYPWLVCEGEEGVLGYASAGPLRAMAAYDWSVELSVYVAESAHDSGIGTALYDAILRTLAEQPVYGAYAAVTVPNPASERLHERMGFEPVGIFPAAGYKREEWHDVQWWYREIARRPSDPEPPQPVDTLRETGALETAFQAGESHLER
ncbi:GNAT family N-acetyltransferase [Halobacteria archaeon AArc-dxtr1]|nr:GNAT family N-acetyltransferase [Halobacteria archaeon AArc-dxtr1]